MKHSLSIKMSSTPKFKKLTLHFISTGSNVISNAHCSMISLLQGKINILEKKKKTYWNLFSITDNLILKVSSRTCTTFHRYPIFSMRYSVMCKVYTGYCGTSEIEHGLCACMVDNPLAKARGLSLRTGAQPMLYLPQRTHSKEDTWAILQLSI